MSSDKFVRVGALNLHYLDHGTEGRPPLVCIHGLTSNAHHFDGLAPHLSARYHVRAFDVRGRGDSDWGPPTEYLTQNYVNDLLGALDALGIGKVTLIGTSMGGIISMSFAGGWPDRVEKLVLNDIGPEVDPAGGQRIQSYVAAAPDRFPDLGAVVAYYRENYPPMRRLSDAQVREFVASSVKPAADGRGLAWKMDPAVRGRRGPSQQRLDLWVPFARITCPILVVRGHDSDILSVRTAEQMRTTHKDLRVVEIPGVGHAPSLTEPESLATIRAFLSL
ncbi:MAG TPA: alpha/beta hydrolase [Candidatus Binataceae bacterium]|nr:alpha/beta hydrolase [Candidatus Binataceae bacterium]